MLNSETSTSFELQVKSIKFPSQSEEIKAYLLSGKSLTSLDGLRLFKCWSLTQRIFDLRRQGLPIETEMILLESGKRVARYKLKSIPG
ncbi:MAG: helix-turn-helix domain-containing protein [Ignavibacteria bacterium]|nr:helix-turn-helix domain-containing protein [Ignavibacteria bacterium]